MKRREFLQSSISESRISEEPQNRRTLIRPTAGIEPYTGAWNRRTAAHLLRRTMVGPKRSEITAMASGSLPTTLSTLLTTLPLPVEPINSSGQNWVNGTYDSQNDFANTSYLKAWWMGLLIQQGISIRERMVLFWHNHFVTEVADVPDSRFIYRQNVLFREHALGNIKALVKAATIDPAMLRYLNGNTNTNTRPNENYARELQELFTIGKGPELDFGNYTNYTESDVQAAAKVLTGYRDTGYASSTSPTIGYSFTASLHDTAHKQFSSAYGNRVITGRTGTDGAKELDDLLDMIFSQTETAKFFCRKFYRWFVYYDIDDTVEKNVIEPLAALMRNNNYEIKPVLSALLGSAHFFDENSMGCIIKNPVDFTAGSFRQIGMAAPSLQTTQFYTPLNNLRSRASNLQMNLLDPPNVAGWAAYYQTPDYYELWINSATYPLRGQLTDLYFGTTGLSGILFDRIAYAASMSAPSDPWKLISDLAEDLYPIPLTQNQKDYLMYNAMGLRQNGEYDWTNAWQAYVAPGGTTTTNKNLILKMLDPLLKFMLRMPEFHLM